MFRYLVALGCVVAIGLPVSIPSAGVASEVGCQSEIVLGTSRLGSPIVACQLRGSDPAVKKPLLVVGSMHGSEPAGMDVVDRLTKRDVTGLGANIWVVRTVNPDGVASGIRGNTRGIDLNGNFPTAGWRERSRGTAKWGGPKAASEPETRALMKAVSTLHPKQAVVFHQALNVIDCPPYRSKSLTKRLHALTGYPQKCLPVLPGNFTAWANSKYRSTSALTFELEASPQSDRLDRVAAALVTLASTTPGAPSGPGTPAAPAGPAAPTAGADTGAVVRGQSVTLDVLANDVGANGALVDPRLAVITTPQSGTAKVQERAPQPPQITYTPTLDAPATDSFTYRVTDAGGQATDGSVTLTIANAAPTAVDDVAKVRSGAGAVVRVAVLGNDSDVDRGKLVINGVESPEHGTATFKGKRVTYDPIDGYFGPDSFAYGISDGQGATAQARVALEVVAPVGKLTPVPDEVVTALRTPVAIDVLANDSGGKAPLQVVGVGTAKVAGKQRSGGKVTLARDRRTVTFKPRRTFTGKASFTYTLRDKRGRTAQGRVNVTVTEAPPVSDAPATGRTVSAIFPPSLVFGREYSIDVTAGGFAQEGVAAEVQKRVGTDWQTVTTGTLAATGGSITLPVTPTLAPLTSTKRTESMELRVRATAPDGTAAESVPTSVQVAADISAEVSGPLQRADVPFSYRPGCPVGPGSLRRLTVNYWDYSGAQARGSLIAQANAIDDLTAVFTRAFNAGFRIRSMTPVDAYYDSGQRSPTASDQASMAASNTSAFNCRPVVGNPTKLSAHSHGVAIDINPFENPYAVTGAVYPAGSDKYLKRSPCRTGMICNGGVVATAMQAVGWPWGARWSKPDYQHFSLSGR